MLLPLWTFSLFPRSAPAGFPVLFGTGLTFGLPLDGFVWAGHTLSSFLGFPGLSFVRAVSGTPYARVFAVFLARIPFAVRVFCLALGTVRSASDCCARASFRAFALRRYSLCLSAHLSHLACPGKGGFFAIQARSAFPGSSQSFFLIACLVFPIPFLPLRVIGSLEPLFSVPFPAAQLSAALRFLLLLLCWLCSRRDGEGILELDSFGTVQGPVAQW